MHIYLIHKHAETKSSIKSSVCVSSIKYICGYVWLDDFKLLCVFLYVLYVVCMLCHVCVVQCIVEFKSSLELVVIYLFIYCSRIVVGNKTIWYFTTPNRVHSVAFLRVKIMF
jgi:hypothetical protein